MLRNIFSETVRSSKEILPIAFVKLEPFKTGRISQLIYSSHQRDASLRFSKKNEYTEIFMFLIGLCLIR